MSWRALLLLPGGLVAACSLLIDGESMPLRCSQEGHSGPPACDEGFVCRRGVCVVEQPVSAGGAGLGSTSEGEAGAREPWDESDGSSRN
jgi:hypothetical protein